MKDEKKYKRIIIILSVTLLLLLFVIGLIFSGKLNIKKNETDSSDDKREDTQKETAFDYKNISVENGFSEVSLTDKEKEAINKKLYDEFQPGNGNDPLIKYDDTTGDIVSDDCMKLSFVKWYITFNNKTGYKYDQISEKDENGTAWSKVKYDELEKITKEIFDSQMIACNSNESFMVSEDGYVTLDLGGGGFIPIAIKTLAKYQNGNNYYLLIHMYAPKLTEDSEDAFLENMNDFLTNANDEEDMVLSSKYVKLKYHEKDGKKYLDSFEYLK